MSAAASSPARRPTATRSSGWTHPSATWNPPALRIASRSGIAHRCSRRITAAAESFGMSSMTSQTSSSSNISTPSSAAAAPASAPSLAPSSPAAPRPIKAPTTAPNSAASLPPRSLRLIIVTSPSAFLWTASPSITRTTSFSLSSSNSARISPLKSGWLNPSTSSWTGPMAIFDLLPSTLDMGRYDHHPVSGILRGQRMARARYIANEFSVAIPAVAGGGRIGGCQWRSQGSGWRRYRPLRERMPRSDLSARCCTDLTKLTFRPRVCATVAVSNPSMNLSTMTCR